MKWYYFGNLGLLKCVNHGICIKAFLCLTLFDLLLYKPFFLKLSLVLIWKNFFAFVIFHNFYFAATALLFLDPPCRSCFVPNLVTHSLCVC